MVDLSRRRLSTLRGAILTTWNVKNCDFSFNNLTSLEFSPKDVGGYFNCSYNKLTSLEFGPSEVKRYYDCSSNKLTTLKGSPTKINGNFNATYNRLTNLVDGPEYVKGKLFLDANFLTSMIGFPKFVGKELYITNNPSLIDVSDIFNSKIKGNIFVHHNKKMAMLPLAKFSCVFDTFEMINLDNISSIKEKIIVLQNYLIENGYDENARWKP